MSKENIKDLPKYTALKLADQLANHPFINYDMTWSWDELWEFINRLRELGGQSKVEVVSDMGRMGYKAVDSKYAHPIKKPKSEIKLGDYADAPQYAPNNCTVIGLWEEKVWLLMPGGGTTVAPVEGIVLHRDKIKPTPEELLNLSNEAGGIKPIECRIEGDDVFKVTDCPKINMTSGLRRQIEAFFRLAGKDVKVEIKEVGFTKTKFTPGWGICEKCANTKCRENQIGYFFSEKMPCFEPIDDETIEACCGPLSGEMRDHIKKYHGNEFDLKQCSNCNSWVKFLYPEHGDICLVCLTVKLKKENNGSDSN